MHLKDEQQIQSEEILKNVILKYVPELWNASVRGERPWLWQVTISVTTICWVNFWIASDIKIRAVKQFFNRSAELFKLHINHVNVYFKVQGLSAVSCAKMAEPTEMQFGMLSRVGPGNMAV